MRQNAPTYNLEERTAQFGEAILLFCKSLGVTTITRSLIDQLGANYMEANAASSRKDFQNKIFICKKESQETKHWLRMLLVCFPERKVEIDKLWSEAQALTMIFQKITSSLRNPALKIENSMKIEN